MPSSNSKDLRVVGEAGLEPAHPFEYRHLKPARLPISPLARRARNNSRLASAHSLRVRLGGTHRYSDRCHGYKKCGKPPRADLRTDIFASVQAVVAAH